MTSYEYYISCTLVADKQTGTSAECLRMIFVFILFIRSDHLGYCFLYSWQSTCDFMEYILFDFSVFEQKEYGKIILEA